MPDEARADWQLDLWCDHRDHPAGREMSRRLVGRVLHVRPPEHGALGWLEWREGVLDDPDYPDALQTYTGEAMRLETFGRRQADGSHLPPGDLVPDMTEGQRWRFWCADCHATLSVLHSKLVVALERLRPAGVSSVELAFIREALSRL